MQRANKILLGATLALAGAGALNTNAMARTVIYADIEPPALRVETAPGPRPGYVWVGGNWYYDHHRYNWRHGHWVRERHGYHYVPSRWEREGNRWRYYDYRWDR
ncbi:MAG TPA: YXWGXW repeat-containing protein [Rhodanobacteraceae bacterium]|nr:YXWGXW repeat-containing protein [Rhodanobacteraceae bacterium]